MKMFSLLILLACLSLQATAQKAKPKGKAPVKKAKGKSSTKVKTSGDDELDFFMCYEGGGPCTFSILKGDTLVYQVNKSGSSFNLFIVPNKFTSNAIADYNWFTNETVSRTGKVNINANGLMKGSKYLFDVANGDTKLTDASTLWLSEKSYKEIAAKNPTLMSIDNGAAENFSSPEADESNLTIYFKDKEILLEGFAIENKPIGGSGRKELSYLNISSNLLLLKADLDNGSMVLKEVKQYNAPVKAPAKPKGKAPVKKKG